LAGQASDRRRQAGGRFRQFFCGPRPGDFSLHAERVKRFGSQNV
jgi:hypothetical protein